MLKRRFEYLKNIDEANDELKTLDEKLREAEASILQHNAKMQVVGNEECIRAYYYLYLYTSDPEFNWITFSQKQKDLAKSIRNDLVGEKEINWTYVEEETTELQRVRYLQLEKLKK